MAGGTSDAVEGLLFVFNGEEAEYDWGVAVGVEGCDALCHALANVVEVGSVATDYAAEYDDCVKRFGFDELRCGEGEFNGSGLVESHDIVVGNAGFAEGLDGAVAQRGGYVAVPAGGGNGNAGAAEFLIVVFGSEG